MPSNLEVYGNGWETILQLLTRDEISEITVVKAMNGVFATINGVRRPVGKVGWGNYESYKTDFRQTVLPNMQAAGFDDPEKSSSIYEGALEYLGADRNNRTITVHARFHEMLPPAVTFPSVTIAKRSESLTSLESMKHNGTMDDTVMDFLIRMMESKQTFILSAGTGAGKTTMLRALCNYIQEGERVIICEDSPELAIKNVNTVYMESMPWRPGIDPNDSVPLWWLVAQANRMRTDRIIVGETRGKEFGAFLTGANSGLKGSATTIHADDPQMCIAKMGQFAMADDPGRSQFSVMKDIAMSVDFIIQLGKDNSGRHWVETIEEISNTVSDRTNQISTATIFKHLPNGAFENRLGAMSDVKRDELGY